MRTHVLFIHGAGEGAYKEDKKLAESLQQLLGSSYEVHYPQMENENDAPYDIWVNQIKEELATMSDAVVLVGHSVGGSILIKFHTETKIAKGVVGIFLLAAPFWGGDGGWTYEGYETLMLPNEADTKLSKEVPIFLYQSRDDETVPFAHLKLYARRFPSATVRELDGRGHQLNNDLTEVASDIKKLL
jgi:predicted alpha/beta hydrolase family esterase